MTSMQIQYEKSSAEKKLVPNICSLIELDKKVVPQLPLLSSPMAVAVSKQKNRPQGGWESNWGTTF